MRTATTTRRSFLAGGSAALVSGLLSCRMRSHQSALSPARARLLVTGATELAAIEREARGRLGVAALALADGARLAQRADERFPLCSTFKLLLAAAVLARAANGQEDLARVIPYGEADLVGHAPVAREHLAAGGLSVRELAGAAVTWSDNTAANLLLATLDGPAGLTRFLRSLGDEVTRLDRAEPELNEVAPNDLRDTTTPAAMLRSMQALLIGDALTLASRQELLGWLVASTTGSARLRAGLPADFRAGDKTGTGPAPRNATNDVAILWPPHGQPILVAAYFVDGPGSPDERNATLARVGRVVADTLG